MYIYVYIYIERERETSTLSIYSPLATAVDGSVATARTCETCEMQITSHPRMKHPVSGQPSLDIILGRIECNMQHIHALWAFGSSCKPFGPTETTLSNNTKIKHSVQMPYQNNGPRPCPRHVAQARRKTKMRIFKIPVLQIFKILQIKIFLKILMIFKMLKISKNLKIKISKILKTLEIYKIVQILKISSSSRAGYLRIYSISYHITSHYTILRYTPMSYTNYVYVVHLSCLLHCVVVFRIVIHYTILYYIISYCVTLLCMLLYT